jgi:hypothetical protein
MHELRAANDDRVRALYEPLAFQPFCTGVLEGSHTPEWQALLERLRGEQPTRVSHK